MSKTKSIDLLFNEFFDSQEKLNLMQADPMNSLKVLQKDLHQELSKGPALTHDKVIYRIVVSALGFTVILISGGVIFLAGRTLNNDIPEILIALGSASIGALAGLLTPSPTGSSES